MTPFLDTTIDRVRQLLQDNPGEPEDWPDAAKLRLVALKMDKEDFEEGRYNQEGYSDRTQVQDDLRRIADRIEQLGDLWVGTLAP